MIYTDSPVTDYNNILQYINEATKSLEHPHVPIDTTALMTVCINIRQDFPHVDGIEKASVFKKAAYFIAHFLEKRPIKANITAVDGNAKSDINAVIAWDIAFAIIEGSEIAQRDGLPQKIVSNPLYLSDHSFTDIMEALSSTKICPSSHYHLLAVFLEQIVYKTNPHCEYPSADNGKGYYPVTYSVTGGDSMNGA